MISSIGAIALVMFFLGFFAALISVAINYEEYKKYSELTKWRMDAELIAYLVIAAYCFK